MKLFLKRLLSLSAMMLVLICTAYTQKKAPVSSNKGNSAAVSVLKGTAKIAGKPFISAAGNVAVIVIKSAAKATWATTKFAAKDMLKPVATKVMAPLIVKGTPIVAKYMLKATMLALKKGLPAALKLSLF